MNGMELAKQYFENELRPFLMNHFPKEWKQMAVGLVGEGSECFGFDDELSKDHDFTKRACIFLPREVFRESGRALYEAIEEHTSGTCDIMSIPAFYGRILGLEEGPKTVDDWIYLRENQLSTAVNGEVFVDNEGSFTHLRQQLKVHYPKDVQLFKLAHQAFKMAQSGQYNYLRCMKRKDYTSAKITEADFVRHTVFLVHLLNRVYCPYYKWSIRSLKQLPMLGVEIEALLNRLNVVEMKITKEWIEKQTFSHTIVFEEIAERKAAIIEQVCKKMISFLQQHDYSHSSSDFLVDHARSIQQQIQDPHVKSLSIFAEGLEVR